MFKFKFKLLLLHHKFCVLFFSAIILLKFAQKWDDNFFIFQLILSIVLILFVSVKWLLWKLVYCIRL